MEGRLGAERLKLAACQLLGGALLAVCFFEQVVVQAFNHGVDFLGCAAVEGVVTFYFHVVGEHHQLRHRRQEHGGGFAALAGTHETANRLGEEQRSAGTGGVHAHGEAGHVHAFGHHAHGDHPALHAFTEFINFCGGFTVVREDHGGVFAGDFLNLFGVSFGVRVVGCDDERTGIGHGAAHLGQALISCREHGRNPFAVGVEGGSPRLGGDVLGEAFAEVCRHLFTGGGTPTHLARVRHEDDRAHHVVLQRGAVTVGVVRLGAANTVVIDLVGDERNRGGIRTERGTGQCHAASRVVERFTQAVTPGKGITGVVNLVKNYEGFRFLGVAGV